MFTQDYYTKSGQAFSFSKQQGSDFAKGIAGDFNPLHDISNSRFCIPGDLLFSVMLSQFGVSQQMTFDFQGMVAGGMPIIFVESAEKVVAENDKPKAVLELTRSGEITHNPAFIEGLVRSYVSFSGKTFPHIINKLMKDEGAMINTRKPMVIYDQMSLSFDRFTAGAPEVELHDCKFDVSGKRGVITMNFDIRADQQSIGSGEKKIIMGGLRPYEQPDIDYLVDTYNAARVVHSKS